MEDINIPSIFPKITGLILRKIIYIAFLVTLIYNIYWIYNIFLYLDQIEQLPFSSLTPNNDNYSTDPSNLKENGYSILKYTHTSIIFSFIILLIPRVCCHSNSDCNIICITIRIFFTWIFSLYQMSKTPVFNEKDKENNIDFPCEKNEKYCDFSVISKFIKAIEKYFWLEKIYFSCGIAVTLFIILILALVILKECWRGRGYMRYI